MNKASKKILALALTVLLVLGGLTAAPMTVYAAWGDNGIIDLSALPSGNASSTDPDTPWSWDSTAKKLTLTGLGPYTIEGTANGTARIEASLGGDMEIIMNGHLQAPDVSDWYGHSALTVSGNGDLTLTGSGSLVGGGNNIFAGHGVDARGLNGDVFLSGSLQITGGDGGGGGRGVYLSNNALTLEGTVSLTGGDSSAAADTGQAIHHTSPGNVFVSGQIAVTGGNGDPLQQDGQAIGNKSTIHFSDPAASLTVKNGPGVTAATPRDFVNDTLNTCWDVDVSTISSGTVNEQNITVNIPASSDSLVIELITITTPVISAHPAGQIVVAGQVATFAVVATGVQLTYQWQVDQQDGSGFQNVTDGAGDGTAQYTTPITDIGMDSYTYQVIVSNPAGNVTSSTAELTVTAAAAPSLTMSPSNPSVNIATANDNDSVATPTTTNFSGSPVVYSIDSGTLPAGLSINANSGEIYVATATDLVATAATTVTVKAEYAAESATDTVTITVNAAPLPGTVATPTANPSGGAVTAGTTVSLGCSTPGATIYYTIDGTTPTTANAAYSGPIAVNSAMTIKAIAVLSGMTDSAVMSESYTISVTPPFGTVATPTANPSGGAVTAGTTVSLGCSTPGATIYYTTDGSVPTTASAAYSSSIAVNSAMTIKAIAVFSGMTDSAVMSESYTISGGGGLTGGNSNSTSLVTATPAIPTTLTVDAVKAKAALAAMKPVDTKARITHTGSIKTLAEAWKVFGKTPVMFDTIADKAVQVRITVGAPDKLTKDMMLSGFVKGDTVNSRKALFEKFFQNKVRIVHLEQSGVWGQPVEVAAKVDLTGMDVKNLVLYSYNKTTNTYRQIVNPNAWLDKNGYLHVSTSYAGDIVISEGALVRK